MAAKKTEKKPFPEELKKRMATKKAAKVAEVKTEEVQAELQEVVAEKEVVKEDPKINWVTVVKPVPENEASDLHYPEEQDEEPALVEEEVLLEGEAEVLQEEDIDESGPSEEFTIEGNDAEVAEEVNEEDNHDKEGELLPEGYETTDQEEVHQGSILPEVEKLVNGEKPEEVKEEKPEPPKQRNYYNDRFANTWGGVQYDY